MMTKLRTLKRPELLGGRVYATLREHLRSGRVPVGQPLQEAALAAQPGPAPGGGPRRRRRL